MTDRVEAPSTGGKQVTDTSKEAVDRMISDVETDVTNLNNGFPFSSYMGVNFSEAMSTLRALQAENEALRARLDTTEAKLYSLEDSAWREGEPDKVSGREWFIAHTKLRDRVVLRGLGDQHSYDYTTADHTYLSADQIVKWMQFPDSHFLPPDCLSSRVAKLTAENEALREQAVKVKPLEWLERKHHDEKAKLETMSECGLYKIVEWYDGSGHVLFFGVLGGPVQIDAPSCAGGSDPLKAAAQADYERRILSAIDTVSVAQARKEALEEALEAARREHLEGDCTDDETDAAYDQGVTDCCCAICALIEKEDG